MTNEKAIEQLKALKDHSHKLYADDIQALELAAIYLEAGIPKAVETFPDKAGRCCPECRHSLTLQQDYCDSCGQALDWGRSENA